MGLALIAFGIGVFTVVAAVRANTRFKAETRLPMQWWLDGQVTWSAPRLVALGFMPALSVATLAGYVVMAWILPARPGWQWLVLPILLIGCQQLHLWLITRTLNRRAAPR